MRRYPLDALVAASGLSESALARRIGWSGSTLKMFRADGLSEHQADHAACRLDLHPFEVWHDWFGDEVYEKKTRPRRLHLPGEIASTVVYRNVERRLRDQGLSLERYQLRGFSLAERALLAERENADRGTSVEHPERLISPGQSDVSEALAITSQPHDGVAA